MKRIFSSIIILILLFSATACGNDNKNEDAITINKSEWENLSVVETQNLISEQIKEYTSEFLNGEEMIIRDEEEISNVISRVNEYANVLTEEGIIKGTAYNEEGHTVSFFLDDGSTYVYVPPIADCYSQYKVLSVDTLELLDDIVITSLSGGGSQAAGSQISANVNEYTKTTYSISDSTIPELKELLGKLDEESIRTIFWRGHGSVYTESDGSVHYALIIGDEINEENALKYKNDLTADDGTPRTMCKFDDYYGINDVFFDTYMSEADGGLFYCGSCRGALANQVMAKVMFNKGFDAYCGSNGDIFTLYSDAIMESVAKYLSEKDNSGNYRTIAEAFALAEEECGASDVEFFTKSDDDPKLSCTYLELYKDLMSDASYAFLNKLLNKADVDLGKYGTSMILFENPNKEEFRLIPVLWKEAYTRYINSLEATSEYGDYTYQLIYIDDNEIPELIIDYSTSSLGREVCIYSDQIIKSQPLEITGFYYIERENLFMNEYGKMNYFTTYIFKISDGNIVIEQYEDYHGSDYNYNSEVQQAFDKTKAKQPYFENAATILSKIDDM